MEIQGNKVSVHKSDKELFAFFTQLENFKHLMPESIRKFEVYGDSFLFALKGMPEIKLVLKEKKPFSTITLGAADGKLTFTLSSTIEKISDYQSDVQLIFKGDFNPMMAMMVKKPLTNFINTLTENIAKL
ncbi:MAG: SRPBCC family protein [Flavobacteriaceae bacterium]|nr:MAG: SRPBCC family protein [Flavobacteriaceae bacterium]